jgi:hypothetical protein
MQMYKLGKKPVRFDHRTLRIANYFQDKALPVAPPNVDWASKVPSWPMMDNDTLGDCVPAASGHCIEQWTFFSNPPGYVPTDQQILNAYEAIGGYVPGDPSTDNGCVILDALNYWRKHGIAGHKIFAYATVDWKNHDELRSAINIFGNVYIGIQLPITAQTQDVWTVAPGALNTPNGAPGSWGGHCVPLVEMSPDFITCVTWGQLLDMSYNFADDYIDEAYVIITVDWLEKNWESPSLLYWKQLRADMKGITA